MKFTNLDRLLPFGYIVLVIIGIIKQSVFFYQLDINILKYSSLMDILISPISDLTSHPIIIIALVLYGGTAYLVYSYLLKHPENKYSQSILKIKHLSSPEEVQVRAGNQFLGFLTGITICFFLGLGIGNGSKVKHRIENKELKYQHLITFNSNDSKRVYLIETNTTNYIYIENGSNQIEISPIGAVKSITFLKD